MALEDAIRFHNGEEPIYYKFGYIGVNTYKSSSELHDTVTLDPKFAGGLVLATSRIVSQTPYNQVNNISTSMIDENGKFEISITGSFVRGHTIGVIFLAVSKYNF